MIDGAAPGNDPTLTGSTQNADLAPGTRLAGRFAIERRVGTGGMGVVYRARDEALGITVALKLLRPELATRPEAFERFRQELLLARQERQAGAGPVVRTPLPCARKPGAQKHKSPKAIIGNGAIASVGALQGAPASNRITGWRFRARRCGLAG